MTRSRSPAGSSREAFDAAVAAGDLPAAMRLARLLLKQDPSSRQFRHVRRTAEKLAAAGNALKPFRVAMLSSFSIEFVHDPLIAHGFTEGLAISIHQAGFDQYRQEILDPGSALYRFSADTVVLAVEGKSIAPALYDAFLDGVMQEPDKVIEDADAELRNLLAAFRAHSTAPLLVHNFVSPVWRDLGILDGHLVVGQAALVQGINTGLYALAREFAAVYVVDYAGLVSRAGADNWYDLRLAYFAQAPIAQPMLGRLAREYIKFLRALTGKTRKCLVLDLDNTLWGGVVGEEGPDGIQVGATYPGSAFRDFQQEILKLRKRGVILAIASKNNPGDVDEVFAARSEMVLNKEHFSDIRVSWEPKMKLLTEIAAKLNIGLDHIVFVDDNPVECGLINEGLPMVTVIPLPKQPELYVNALLDDGYFDALSLTAEDFRRGDLYKQRDAAEALRAESGSIEEFYRNLGTEIEIAHVNTASLARAAQMTQKTNQFNTTTIRFTEAEIESRLADPDWVCATVRVKDRFGDSGIAGLMMAHAEDGRIEIETFLLSCRVIGRGVETAMLASLERKAKERGVGELTGKIIPTKKNPPVRALYSDHGFARVDGGGEFDTSTWRREVTTNGAASVPDWIVMADKI